MSQGMDLCLDFRSTTTGCRLFHPPILIWTDPSQPSDQFWHSSLFLHEFSIHRAVLDQFFIHRAVLDQFFIDRDLLVTFPKLSTFLLRHDLGLLLSSITTFCLLFQIIPSRALRHVKFSNNSFKSLLLRSPASSESSALSFHFSHSHFHTTVGHVITLRRSLWNHFHSHRCVNHRILE